jgi:hypothetical protein
VNAYRLGRLGEIAVVVAQGRDYELPLELTPSLFERNASADQLVHDLIEATVEIPVPRCHFRPHSELSEPPR